MKGSESSQLCWHFSNLIHENILHLSLPDVRRAGLSWLLILVRILLALTGTPRCLNMMRTLRLTFIGAAGGWEISRVLSRHLLWLLWLKVTVRYWWTSLRSRLYKQDGFLHSPLYISAGGSKYEWNVPVRPAMPASQPSCELVVTSTDDLIWRHNCKVEFCPVLCSDQSHHRLVFR